MNELLPDQIETCKREIAYAADYAGLKWSRDDLISIHDDNLGEVVFLRRFNPREKIDDDGNVVTRDGKPVMVWSDTMWLEYIENKPRLEWEAMDEDRVLGKAYDYTFRVNMPRLICVAPWLIRIIKKDGTVTRHDIA